MTSRVVLSAAILLGLTLPSQSQTVFRTYTGISGFYDYQTNGRTPQYLRACPGATAFHTIMTSANDSISPDVSRRTAYAFSSNSGATWNTFNDIHVPNRRSGFPALDLGMGTIACAPIIANHNVIGGSGNQSIVYLDSPPGTGAFSELSPAIGFGSDEVIWPEVAGAADGSIFLIGTRQTAGTIHYTRTGDYVSWAPFGELPGAYASGGSYVAEANTRNRIGVTLSGQMGISWFESTNNGINWPQLPIVLLQPTFTVGRDTFRVGLGLDLVYSSDDTLITFEVAKVVNGNPSTQDGIGFWSEATGFVLAVPHTSIPGAVDSLRRPQVRQATVGMPCIGLSGSSIVIAFQAFMPETSSSGFNYSDIFLTYSTNGGATWPTPLNISSTQLLDERFPSMSKWNAANQANMAWQEDPEPGSAIISDPSPIARVRQVFCRVSNFLTSVSEDGSTTPNEFALSQNYPNPFNPKTVIQFTVGSREHVRLVVFDILGREVATLVNGLQDPGFISVEFDGRNLAGGIYFYRLSTPGITTSRKMLLLN